MRVRPYLAMAFLLAPLFAFADSATDPFIWLEDSTSANTQAWVKSQNQTTLGALTSDARYQPLYDVFMNLGTAADRLPDASLANGYLYNLWRDSTHIRGLWRRVKLDDYGATNIPWETIIDVDQLAASENQDWVWMNSTCLPPAYEKCLINLSHGGKDAVVIREFDVATKSFVTDGFNLPEAKSNVSWVDANTLLVGTDWGSGTMTTSGYPAQVRIWKRGTPLTAATLVYTAATTSEDASGTNIADPTGSVSIVEDDVDFFNSKRWTIASDGTLKPLAIPSDATVTAYFRGQLLLTLSSDWQVTASLSYPSGSIVAFGLSSGETSLVYTPDARSAVSDVHTTKDLVVVNTLNNVTSQLLAFTLGADGSWQQKVLPLPDRGTAAITGNDAFDSPLLVSFQSFLTPEAVYRVDNLADGAVPTAIRQAPARFDASQFAFEQYEAVSRDGTHVSYFLVHAKSMTLNGSNPTLLYGYGGFAISMTPSYSGSMGNAWLAKGGVYVLANIRGGGEFGPAWHEAAMKHNRQRAYDDFIAVAQDLIDRKVTDQKHLGVEGGSNGGLLVGTVMVERPDLFNAVVCQVPLLDMIRFPLLGAGASWEGEYGDPNDAADRAAILGYSPYENLKANVSYPRPFFVTSTDDDRVTPAHARKMAAAMAANQEPYLFYESAEGGHATPASIEDAATSSALQYVYLYQQLMGSN